MTANARDGELCAVREKRAGTADLLTATIEHSPFIAQDPPALVDIEREREMRMNKDFRNCLDTRERRLHGSGSRRGRWTATAREWRGACLPLFRLLGTLPARGYRRVSLGEAMGIHFGQGKYWEEVNTITT